MSTVTAAVTPLVDGEVTSSLVESTLASMAGRDPGEPSPARRLVAELAGDGWLDEVMAQSGDRGVELTGSGGFLPELIKAVLERGLAAELTEHLGYEKGDPAGAGSGNSRNGSTGKTLLTEVGPIELDTPRDRAGTFTPRLVPKGTRRLGGLSDMVISLYAGGMTVRDIQHHLGRVYGTDISHDTISKITDEVLDEVKAWQARPLDPVYPVVFIDALVVKVKDGNVVRNKAAHIVVGVDTDGIKHVLGIWVQQTEGAKFWAGVLAELRNRGVRDVLIACCDGLTGLPEAIEATWPHTVVQTSSVHYEAAGSSRWSPAPSRVGPVQTRTFGGPHADPSTRDGGRLLICQRESRRRAPRRGSEEAGQRQVGDRTPEGGVDGQRRRVCRDRLGRVGSPVVRARCSRCPTGQAAGRPRCGWTGSTRRGARPLPGAAGGDRTR